MDISSVSNATTNASMAATGSQVELTMLRKSLDIQEQSAAQLINAIPQQPALASSGNLGRNVNTFA